MSLIIHLTGGLQSDFVNLLTELHLLVFDLGRVLLIQGILVLAHLLCHLDSELLSLLVPAPLVDLALTKACLLGNHH